MLRNECMFLSEALVTVFITSMIVSVVCTVVPLNLRAADTVHEVSQRLYEREREELSQWQGCRICAIEEDPDM